MNELRKSRWKNLFMVLIIEILAIFVILALFKIVEPRLWAARWASTSFLIESLAILYLTWPFGKKGYWSLTAPIAFIFLIIFVLPMLIFRWSTEADFIHLQWLGMSGPVLHDWSSKFYYLLLGATMIDLIYTFYLALPAREDK